MLKNVQDVLLIFGDRSLSALGSLNVTKMLLKRAEVNEMISLNEIYIETAFERIRTEAMVIIEGYFDKLNLYYDMLFGIFVSCLSLF
jgi:hypothetical protein